MTVYNTGEEVLEVSNIYSIESWVKSFAPSSRFNVAPDDSQMITVTVSSAGLDRRRYDGTIHIISNDPDTPDYQEPLVFDVDIGVALQKS
ncbi:MAG: hypothetical protein ACE5OR_12235 [bacterium]